MKLKTLFIQAVQYGLVGFLNTGVTLLVIFILKDLLDLSLYIANFVGYLAGLINSFIWNRNWTFRSMGGNVTRQALFFVLVWAVSYLFQLGVLFIMESILHLPDYPAIFIGMVSYTVLSFFLNRFITFQTVPENKEIK